MDDLCLVKNIDKPIMGVVQFHNINKITQMDSSWCMLCRDIRYGEVDVTYDSVDYKALYCYIGEKIGHAEVLLFENGDYICYAM